MLFESKKFPQNSKTSKDFGKYFKYLKILFEDDNVVEYPNPKYRRQNDDALKDVSYYECENSHHKQFSKEVVLMKFRRH